MSEPSHPIRDYKAAIQENARRHEAALENVQRDHAKKLDELKERVVAETSAEAKTIVGLIMVLAATILIPLSIGLWRWALS